MTVSQGYQASQPSPKFIMPTATEQIIASRREKRYLPKAPSIPAEAQARANAETEYAPKVVLLDLRYALKFPCLCISAQLEWREVTLGLWPLEPQGRPLWKATSELDGLASVNRRP